MLENIQKTLFQIRSTLMNDETLRKLVYNDNNNALEIAAPSVEEVEDYFSLSPIYEFNTNSATGYNHNCAITMFFTRFDSADDLVQVAATLSINVIVNNRKWVLTEQQIRPLMIINRITELLCDKKFSIATPLVYEGASDLILTNQIGGYNLTFTMIDGSAEIENF